MANDKKPGDAIANPGGIFSGISNQIKLILRLMADRRVNPLLKTLPVGSLFYFLLFPDIAPGPFDDALIVWLGTTLFVELCPPEIVNEHLDQIQRANTQTWRSNDDEVIDTEFRDLE